MQLFPHSLRLKLDMRWALTLAALGLPLVGALLLKAGLRLRD